MTGSQRHIVSKVTWSTSFDVKERAVELQNRISSWDLLHLEGEIDRELGQICPADQTWKIDQLELDLGTIHIDDFESELTHRFAARLAEKLSDELRFPGNNSNIVITATDTPHIDVLNSFLLYGILPWNYKETSGSINEMLAGQLSVAFRDTIDWLIEAGRTGERVRKRMAWQLSEENLRDILKGLEPNNHTEVIVFSEEMVKLQKKETVVQTGETEFRKNLWFWILNYLYAERGSVFNKMAFVKSSIRQMAAHYNIAYDELLEMIRKALDVLRNTTYIKPDFIAILHALAALEKNIDPAEPLRVEKDSWQLFENWLCGYTTKWYTRAVFNDMVAGLSREDKQRFRRLLLLPEITTARWQLLAGEFTGSSRDTILCALDEWNYETVSACISFFRLLEISADAKNLWVACVGFLQQSNGVFHTESLLRYCLSAIEKQVTIDAEELLIYMMSAVVPSAAKNHQGLDIYHNLSSIFRTDIEQKKSGSFTSYFYHMADALCQLLATAPFNRERFIVIQRSLLKSIHLHPAAAFSVLIDYKDKKALQRLLPFVLTRRVGQLLMAHTGSGTNSAILLHLKQAATKYYADTGRKSVLALLEKHLDVTAVRCLILYPGQEGSLFLRHILAGISSLVSRSELAALHSWMQQLPGDDYFLSWNPATFVFEKNEAAVFANDLPLLSLAKQILQNSPENRLLVARMLANGFSEPGFTQSRRSGDTVAIYIIERLLGGGVKLMETLVKQYAGILIAANDLSETQINFRLKELFWKCVLDYTVHNGSVHVFAEEFRSAVRYHFAQSLTTLERITISFSTGQNQKFSLQPGMSISGKELFVLVSRCFETGSTSVVHNDTVFQVNELVSAALGADPLQLRRMIAGLAMSEKVLAFLSKSFSFSQFIFIAGYHSPMRQAVSEIENLYTISCELFDDRLPAAVYTEYWKQVYLLIKTGNWSQQQLEQFVKISFRAFAVSPAISTARAEQVFRNNRFHITPAIQSMLSQHFPLLAGIAAEDGPRKYTALLVKWHDTGMLEQLVIALITRAEAPLWMDAEEIPDAGVLLNEIVRDHPSRFLSALRQTLLTAAQLEWLTETVQFERMSAAIAAEEKNRQTLLSVIGKMHAALAHITVNGISSRELQQVLFRKVFTAWMTNNWKLLSAATIWNELIWDVCVKRNVERKQLLQELQKCRLLFPPVLQISLTASMDRVVAIPAEGAPPVKPKKIKTDDTKKTEVLKNGVLVRNAGLVILNSYIPLLLGRLGIMEEGKFLSDEARFEAVHYLQYLVTGQEKTEESFLTLNKVLCGVPLSEPVTDGICIAEVQREIIEGLINAAIGHWPSAGTTTINGFRGNWLVRNGILTEEEGRWELTVERKAYDLLFNHSPFSFSIINYAWMDKPLHIKWPY
jgi:hypothetical protein